MFVTSTVQLLAELVALVAATAPFNGVKWALYTNDVSPAPGSTLADFTITDFGGLTNQKSVTWGTPFINDQAKAEARGAALTWTTVSVPSPGVTAYGWVELDSTGAVVLRAEKFAVPYTFSRAGQPLTIVPRLILGN